MHSFTSQNYLDSRVLKNSPLKLVLSENESIFIEDIGDHFFYSFHRQREGWVGGGGGLSSKFGLWVRNAIKASWSPIAFNPSSLKWDSFILLTARPSIYKTNENNTLKPQGAICLYYEEWLDS